MTYSERLHDAIAKVEKYHAVNTARASMIRHELEGRIAGEKARKARELQLLIRERARNYEDTLRRPLTVREWRDIQISITTRMLGIADEV